MSKSQKKGDAHVPEVLRPVAGAENPDEVVHVPKGSSRLRFLLTLTLTIFVLLVFTVGDSLMDSFNQQRTSDVYMTWDHPQKGTQKVDAVDLMNLRREQDDLYTVLGQRVSRKDQSDEHMAYLLIADTLASESGIEVPDSELRRVILEGLPGGGLQPFLSAENYRQRLQAAGVSAQSYETSLRRMLRVMRYQSSLAFTLGQPTRAAVESTWKEAHQEYAFDLIGLKPDDTRAAAEAELPDEAGLQAWYEALDPMDKQRLFGVDFLPERTVLGLLSWKAGEAAPAALLEAYPRPADSDLDALARTYYDSFLARRYRLPQESTEPAEPGVAVDKLYKPYEEVSEAAHAESQVNAALRDLLLDLRKRLAAEEAVDLPTRAAELGLTYESDGLARAHDEWAAVDPWLADAVGFTPPDGLVAQPVVGTDRIWLPRVLERKPSEAPPFAAIAEKAKGVWVDERAAALATEKLEALAKALAPADAKSGAATDAESKDEASQQDEAKPASTVDAATFAAQAQAAGLTVQHVDWFDPARAAEASADDKTPAIKFLTMLHYPGSELYDAAEGTVIGPRPDLDGQQRWLVRTAGKREPAAVDITAKEFQSLSQQALYQSISDTAQRLGSPETLTAQYGLKFPGRKSEG